MGKLLELTEKNNQHLHLRLQVENLDCATASAIYRELSKFISRADGKISLDLSKIEEFESLALSLFPALRADCEIRKIDLEIEGANPSLDAALKKKVWFKNYRRLDDNNGFGVVSSIGWVGGMSWEFGQLAWHTVGFIGELTAAIWDALIHPGKVRWRETLYYMDMCGSDALPISALICFLMGLILGFQGALQLHKYGADIFLADGVALSIVKELGPLMVAIICTGRAGSAFAAEIGTMKVGEEIDALITMGFVPSRFLVIPKLIALLLVMPLLTIFGDIVGIIGGMCVAYFQLGIPVLSYYNRTLLVLEPAHFAESISKSLIFAFIIAAVGCMRGFQAKNDAQGVGRAATSAVVTCIFLLIVADTVLALLFNLMIYR